MPTKTIRKALIYLEDLALGSGTATRGTSNGGSQTLTKINLSGILVTVTTVTSTPYSATSGVAGVLLVNAASAAITINLPAASGNSGLIFYIKKTDATANIVTIDPNSTETIDGSSTYVLSTQNEFIQVACNGRAWFIIGQS